MKRQKEWGNDVLTVQPMDWPVEWQANGLVGFKVKDDYVRRCWVFMTRRDNTHLEGDTRTHILHFKENPLFSPAFVCATKKNQNKIVCAGECTTNRQEEDGPYCCVFDCTLCGQYKTKACLIHSFIFPLTKMVEQILVCEQPPKAQHCQPYWTYISARPLGPCTK